MEYPWWYSLFTVALWFLSLCYCYIGMSKYSLDRSLVFSDCRKTMTLLFGIILIFSFWEFTSGDDERYAQFVEEDYKLYWDMGLNYMAIEKFYAIVAKMVNGNYLLWRMVVYGFAVLLSYINMGRFGCRNFLTMFVFVVLAMPSYGSTRAVIAYALFLFGLSFLKEKSKWLSFSTGIVLCFFSLYLHNTMILLIVLLPFCLFRLTKKRIKILIIMLPIFIFLVRLVFSIIPELSFLSDTAFGKKTEAYTEKGGGTPMSFLMYVLVYLRYLVIIIMVYYSVKAELKLSLPYNVSKVIRFSFLLFYVCVIIYFSFIPNAYFFATRYVTMLPFFLYAIVAYYINEEIVIKKNYIEPYLRLMISIPIVIYLSKVYYLYSNNGNF